MDTQVRTPQRLFAIPQQFRVPLFQRPYVWNEPNQWDPLWRDLTRVAERALRDPHVSHRPHFLGAVVLQEIPGPTGNIDIRTIIDGQQRLTTLQLLFDAVQSELVDVGADRHAAGRVRALVNNAEEFCERPEDRFKVWPTNRDRAAFAAVMGAPHPVDYGSLGFHGERLIEAHHFFARNAREWLLLEGEAACHERAVALETAMRDLIHMVVIDLAVDEDAQEIFETLNARGAQLTAADLVKNFVFQRLLESGADVELAYQQQWAQFETAFWEEAINVGRFPYQRSSIFINHWLISRTGEEIVARDVFGRFRDFADNDADEPMPVLLQQLTRAALLYRAFIEGAHSPGTPAGRRLELFAYRTGVLESESVKPLVLHLLDPEAPAIPEDQLIRALDVVESWMVRRALLRSGTKSYTQVIAELITQLRKGDRETSGDLVQDFFANQHSTSRYWPDDIDLAKELAALAAYRRIPRPRLRMVLEAIEDNLRGFTHDADGPGEERVSRKLTIEHIMPQRWEEHWPLPESVVASERNMLIDSIGNLTLLTKKLNPKLSNSAWLGADGKGGKRSVLEEFDVYLMNRRLVRAYPGGWDERSIRGRTKELTTAIASIWPVPEGHRSGVEEKRQPPSYEVQLSDLIAAGWLTAGMALFARSGKRAGTVVATLLPDGRLDLGGDIYDSPSAAAGSITGRATNGWWFLLVEKEPVRSLRLVRREYLDSVAGGSDDEDGEDDEA